MSEHLTRDQLTEQTAEAVYEASRPPFEPTGPDWADLPDQWRWLNLVGPALPVIAKAVTDRVRAHHHREDPWCLGDCPADVLCDEIDTEMGVQR